MSPNKVKNVPKALLTRPLGDVIHQATTPEREKPRVIVMMLGFGIQI